MNSRTFRINIDPKKVGIPFGTKPHPSKEIVSVMLSHGTYFYMSKDYKIPAKFKDRVAFGKHIQSYIITLINKEVRQLMKYWIQNVENYFNRRAYGRYFGNPNTGANRRTNIRSFIITPTQMKLKGNQPYPQIGKRPFKNTGQLKNSLRIMNVSIWGAELYVTSVYAPTNNADYVNFLIHGTRTVRGTPYIPELDKRIHAHGRWIGITHRYWERWQKMFEQRIHGAESRLNAQISQYIKAMGAVEGMYHLLQQPTLSPVQRPTLMKESKRITTTYIRAGRKLI